MFKNKLYLIMILIADSGSTKCDWVLCDEKYNIIKHYNTKGLNPYFVDKKTIIEELNKIDLIKTTNKVRQIYFYGSGCYLEEQKNVIKKHLKSFFLNSEITIRHDLEASCYAFYKNKPNITCILGTGSNSCFVENKEIIRTKPSLGFLLGDEASGSFFGKKILQYYFNNKLTKDLKKELESNFITDYKIIIEKIYNNNRPNMFLAKYFPFVSKNKNHPIIRDLINSSLRDFFDLSIACFQNHKDVKIHFSGSVAFYLKKEIQELLDSKKCFSGDIIKNPLKELVNNHFKNK